jgi:hypothetical protein
MKSIYPLTNNSIYHKKQVNFCCKILFCDPFTTDIRYKKYMLITTGFLDFVHRPEFYKFRTMGKVQKPSSNECYTPSSESFRRNIWCVNSVEDELYLIKININKTNKNYE